MCEYLDSEADQIPASECKRCHINQVVVKHSTTIPIIIFNIMLKLTHSIFWKCPLYIYPMNPFLRKIIIINLRILKKNHSIIKKNTNNKCYWLGCREKRILVYCWWECTLVQPLWKTVWKFLKKTKNKANIWPRNSTPVYITKKKK